MDVTVVQPLPPVRGSRSGSHRCAGLSRLAWALDCAPMLREATPSPHLTRRALLRGAAAATLLAAAGCAERKLQPVPRASASLRLLGETSLPHRMDFKG